MACSSVSPAVGEFGQQRRGHRFRRDHRAQRERPIRDPSSSDALELACGLH
jgi:hypothetical protein